MAAKGELKYGIVISADVGAATAGLDAVQQGLGAVGAAAESAGDAASGAADSLALIDAAMGDLEQSLVPANELQESLGRIKDAAVASTGSTVEFIKATQAAMKAGLSEANALKVADRAIRATASSGKSAAAAADSLAKAMTRAAATTEGLNKAAAGLRVARENVDNFTGRAKAGLGSVLAVAQGVEDSLARLAVNAGPQLGDLDATLGKVREGALAWSREHTQSATTYIDTATSMIRSGLDEAAAIKATETALRVATATQSDAAAVGAALGVVYTQMGDSSKDAGEEIARLGDVLTRASQVAGVEAGALAAPMKSAAPAAKAAKVPFEQLVSVIGALSSAGVEGGAAGASFAAVLGSLEDASQKLGFEVSRTADGGTDLVATLAELEQRYGAIDKMTPELTARMQEAFGPAAFAGLSSMLGQTEAMSTALGKMKDSAGAAAAAQARLEGTSASQMKIAQQQVEGLKIELAAGLAPALIELIPPFTALVDRIGAFAKEHPALVGYVGTLAVMGVAAGSVLGPLISMGGALASVGSMLVAAATGTKLYAAIQTMGLVPALSAATASAWSFAAALLANPITWIVLALVALAAVIYIYWEPISEFFIALWDKIKVGFSAAWDAIVGVWDKVVGFFTGIWDEIKGAFQDSFVKGVLTVLKYISPITWIVKAFSAIGPWLLEWGVKIGKIVLDAMAALPGLLLDAGKWLLTAFVGAMKWLLDANTRFWTGLGQLWLKGAKAALDLVLGIFRFFADGVRADLARVTGFFDAIWTRIKTAVDGGISGVIDLIAEFHPVALIAKGFDAVAQWLFGFSLADAGRNIVGTIVTGIKSMAAAPVDAMMGIVQKVRNLLPFSPAKDGPLKDLHKVKLVETVADAVRPEPLVHAMAGAAGDAMAAIQTAPIPSSALRSAAGRRATGADAASGGGSMQFSIVIHVGAGAERGVEQELDAYFRNPSKLSLIAGGLGRLASQRARTDLG